MTTDAYIKHLRASAEKLGHPLVIVTGQTAELITCGLFVLGVIIGTIAGVVIWP